MSLTDQPQFTEHHQGAGHNVSTVTQITEKILHLLLPHRRRVPGETLPHVSGFGYQYAQIAQFVRADEPVLFTLPAFPCKSPNPDKVLGELPDEGERLSLIFLNDLCTAVEQMYPPGARMLICSDGHIFGDLIGVADHVIDAYRSALREMIEKESLGRTATFDLGDVLGDLDYDEKRARAHEQFAPNFPELRHQIRTQENAARIYRGITRFLVEDTTGFTGSRSALQRQCRERAYGVIQRSNAWSTLIAQHFPRSVRLSIHPQAAGSSKFGIRLLDINNMWTTPWHSCVLAHPDGTQELLPHHRARQQGTVVRRNGRPSHYAATISVSQVWRRKTRTWFTMA